MERTLDTEFLRGMLSRCLKVEIGEKSFVGWTVYGNAGLNSSRHTVCGLAHPVPLVNEYWRDYARNELRGRGFTDAEIRFCSNDEPEEIRSEFESQLGILLRTEGVTAELEERFEAMVVEVEPRRFHYIFFCPMIEATQ